MIRNVLIVGAGSAGSVLAERLSADPSRMVTVVEAGPGPADPVVRELVGNALSLPIGPKSPVVRRYLTRLTDHPVRTADIVRGETVGGSGAVNGCYFWRALPQDFGSVPGWSWADVEGHYQAVESRIAAHPTAEFSTGTERFLTAVTAAGYRSSVAPVPLNIADGRRMGPGAVFLEPVLHRPNLTVLTGIRVTGVRFSGARAVGVDATGSDGPVAIEADQVVLSAGAIATAQLLMLSGIGPAEQLAALGIATRADLPVGLNCWDHPEWVMSTGWPSVAERPVLEVVLGDQDLEIRPYTTGFGSATTGIGVALMRPQARGRVSLTAADPAAPPLLQHRYDSEPADIAALRRGCELVAEIIGDGTVLGEPAWSTSQHLSGTAPMGDDRHAVVDPHCRVRGIDNLWVVDGSVIPTPLSRGPHATIAMIGHRAAGFIQPFL
ncbi:MAG: mycofactocin dehydrogenase MftG [Mycobacterium sp.]